MELEEALRRRRVTQPRQPLDERTPSGQSVAELMMAQSALRAPMAQPTSLATMGEPPPPPVFVPGTPPSPATGPVPTTLPPGSIHLGSAVRPNASRLEELMAERQALNTDPGSRVRRTNWGYEQQPPEQSPSRLRHAGIGAGTGAIIAGQATHGDPWGTLAGTVVGALTGGVSPTLMQAFQRRQELDRNAGELSTEQQLQLGSARIDETTAQAEQRRLEPYLRAQQLEQQQRNAELMEQGRNDRATAANKTRVQTAAEANKLRQAQLEETQKRTAETVRHNKVVEGKPSGSNEKIVNGAIYRKDAEGVYRLAPGSPPPLPSGTEVRITENTAERAAKGKQAAALYQKGSDYWDQAKAKRAEADRLSKGDDGQPSRIRATQNEDAIKRLIREAEGLENKTREVQIQGDKLAAESEATGDTQPASIGKAFDLGRWKRDHPGADPSSVIQRAKDARMRIIE